MTSKWYSVKKHMVAKGLGMENNSAWSDNKIKMNEGRLVSIWKFKGNDSCYQYKVGQDDDGNFYVETWDGWSIRRKIDTKSKHYAMGSKPKDIADALEWFINSDYEHLKTYTKMDNVWD